MLPSLGSAAERLQAVFKHSIGHLCKSERRSTPHPCQSCRHRWRYHRKLRAVSFGKSWLERRSASGALSTYIGHHMACGGPNGHVWLQIRNVDRVAQVQVRGFSFELYVDFGLKYCAARRCTRAWSKKRVWQPDGKASGSSSSRLTKTASKSTCPPPSRIMFCNTLNRYKRIAAFNRKCGIDVHEITPAQVKQLFPLCKTDDLLAGFYVCAQRAHFNASATAFIHHICESFCA